MIRNYYYNQQLKKFILGFANVFTGMQVTGGLDGAGKLITMTVPVRYGSSDRVTAAIAAGNTQNKLHTIPMMSAYMTGLELAPDRLHGVNQVDRRTMLEQGGVFPDDIKTLRRVMAIPYNMQMELAVYASNTDQMFQILEQILILFDYDLQLQFNDAPFDWTKIAKLFLRGMQNEENYPMGVDRRMIIWTLQFELPVWLSPPIEVRNDLIQSITVRIGDLDKLTLDEIDENGELVPFGSAGPVTAFTVTGDEGPGVWDSTLASVVAGAFVIGQTYEIETLGTTDFTHCGSISNTIGTTFVATNAGSGNGTATINANIPTGGVNWDDGAAPWNEEREEPQPDPD
jgi:hypothetical protein